VLCLRRLVIVKHYASVHGCRVGSGNKLPVKNLRALHQRQRKVNVPHLFVKKEPAQKTPHGFFCLALFGSGFDLGINANLLLISAQSLKPYHAVNLGVQCIIITDAHVQAGMNFRAALANKDVACQNELSVGALGAQSLSMAIASVTGGAHSFFMREQLEIHLKHASTSVLSN
jgi:hypothetical protein